MPVMRTDMCPCILCIHGGMVVFLEDPFLLVCILMYFTFAYVSMSLVLAFSGGIPSRACLCVSGVSRYLHLSCRGPRSSLPRAF